MKVKPIPIFEKRHKCYRLHFCWKGKQYRNRYIANKEIAYRLQHKINQLVMEIKEGWLIPPQNISLTDFVFGSVDERKKTEDIEIPFIILDSISELIEEYLLHSTPPAKAKSTWLTEKIHLEHLKRFLDKEGYRNISLSALNVRFFDLYKQFRYSQGVRTDTVNKELATIQTMLQMAVQHKYISSNIVKEVKRDKSEIPSDRFRPHSEVLKLIASGHYTKEELKEIKRYQYLTMDEVEELISLAKGKWIYPILVAFAYTGIRRGELVKLEWRDIDLESDPPKLYIKSEKQSQKQRETSRAIPIHDRLLPILKEMKKATGHYRWVFYVSGDKKLSVNTMREAFRYLIENTHFEGVGYHIFRHSFISNLAAAGVEQYIIDELVGHQTEAMRRRYRHLFPQDGSKAINRLNGLASFKKEGRK